MLEMLRSCRYPDSQTCSAAIRHRSKASTVALSTRAGHLFRVMTRIRSSRPSSIPPAPCLLAESMNNYLGELVAGDLRPSAQLEHTGAVTNPIAFKPHHLRHCQPQVGDRRPLW